jgi:hypothetical protein
VTEADHIRALSLRLSLVESADSAAAATALLIEQSAHTLDPDIAFNIAVYGFIEGSKTFPEPIMR